MLKVYHKVADIMKLDLSKLIVIVGPTGSGKSNLAIDLTKKFNGEIISADSRQIYKGMDIGTGKVMNTSGAPHHLLDIVEPWEEYNVADFKCDALAIIQDILRRGKLPILVGGTNLWVQAVVDNLDIPNVPPNKKLREEFERALQESRIPALEQVQYGAGKNPRTRTSSVRGRQESRVLEKWYKRLLKLDLDAEQFVPKDNPRRIIRALEVCLATGKPFSKLRKKGQPLFEVLKIGVDVPRAKLYPAIDARVEKMLRAGLFDEVKRVYHKTYKHLRRTLHDKKTSILASMLVMTGCVWKLPAFTGIGYREWKPYFELPRNVSGTQKVAVLKEVAQRIKYNTHAYVRRQMAWMRRDGSVRWVKNSREATALVKIFIKRPLHSKDRYLTNNHIVELIAKLPNHSLLSFQRKRESTIYWYCWIPAFAGMTKIEFCNGL